MRSRRTTPTSRPERGFSLLELLVTIVVAGVALASAVSFYAKHALYLRQSSFRIEAQQALRASLDAIARDVRLGGACLPTNGAFVALDGTEGAGNPDSITVVTGLVQNSMACIVATVLNQVNAGQSTVTIDTTAGNATALGFAPNQLAYIRDPNGGGELRTITAVGANTITLAQGVGQIYPATSGIYAVDMRRYWVDVATNPPTLMLTINQNPAQQFAAGFRNLQIQYVLNRNCPTCDLIDTPPLIGSPGAKDTATWRLVNEVIITATVETIGAAPQNPTEMQLTEMTRAKPRNLLQPGA